LMPIHWYDIDVWTAYSFSDVARVPCSRTEEIFLAPTSKIWRIWSKKIGAIS